MRAGIPIVATLLACADSPPASTPPSRAPEHALAQLRKFTTARDALDERVLTEIASPAVVSFSGDPVSGVADYGRAALVKTWKRRVGNVIDKCVLELELAGARDAIGLAHCTSEVPAKKEPVKRTRKTFRIYELALGDDGTIVRATVWADAMRALRQVGVMEDTDPRPDVATGRSLVALVRGERVEATNDERARAIVTALDRRDFGELERSFAAGYVQHRFSDAEPRTFAAASDVTRFVRDELAACETSAYRVLTTLAATDWVALRLGRGCTNGDTHSYATHLWLLRFVDGRVVESWDAWSRQDELRHMNRFSVPEQRRRIEASGL